MLSRAHDRNHEALGNLGLRSITSVLTLSSAKYTAYEAMEGRFRELLQL